MLNRAIDFIACFAALGLLTPAAQAQGSSAGRSTFLAASESGPGAVRMQSASFQLDAGFGSGVVAGGTTSTSWVIQGSWLALPDGSHRGKPWVTGIVPPFTPLGGLTSHRVVGTELQLGAATTCSVGGVAATVTARRVDEIQVTLGVQRVPGWQPVAVQNSGGVSTLVRGVGVRPLLDIEVPFDDQGLRSSEIVFHGERGDLVIWMLAAGKFPFPVPLPGYGHGLELDLASLFVVAATPAGSDGRAVLPLPAVAFRRPLLMQGLVLATIASYRPGAFTNVVSL